MSMSPPNSSPLGMRIQPALNRRAFFSSDTVPDERAPGARYCAILMPLHQRRMPEPMHSVPSPNFPQPWLDLLVTKSSLGPNAESCIRTLESRVDHHETLGKEVFPPREMRYRALEAVSPGETRVVVLGQDPYHGTVRLADGTTVPEATGLAFSVPRGARLPPSLRNIFKEMSADLAIPMPLHGDLGSWASQGVLLLNTVLTVERDSPKSHDKFGWQSITSALLQGISRQRKGLVFMLWGNSARGLRGHIADQGHTIIESSHPSPIGGSCNKGFFGSRPFSRANEALCAAGYPPIRWG